MDMRGAHRGAGAVRSRVQRRWRLEASLRGLCVAPGALVLADAEGRLVAVDVEAWTQRWSWSCDAEALSAPVFGDGRVYVVDSDARAHALDLATGALVWSAALAGSGEIAALVFWRGMLWVDGGKARIYKVDAASGRVVEAVASSVASRRRWLDAGEDGAWCYGAFGVEALDAAPGTSGWFGELLSVDQLVQTTTHWVAMARDAGALGAEARLVACARRARGAFREVDAVRDVPECVAASLDGACAVVVDRSPYGPVLAVTCLDAGLKQRWSKVCKSPLGPAPGGDGASWPEARAVVGDALAWVLRAGGIVEAYELGDGALRWRVELGEEAPGDVLEVRDGLLFVRDARACVVVLDASTGAWTHVSVDDSGDSPVPVLGPRVALGVSRAEQLRRCVDPVMVLVAAFVLGSMVYVAGWGGGVVSLNMAFLAVALLGVVAVLAWRIAALMREARVVREGTLVLGEVAGTWEGRPITPYTDALMEVRYTDPQHRERVVDGELADHGMAERFPPGTPVWVLIDPGAPSYGVVPAFRRLRFEQRDDPSEDADAWERRGEGELRTPVDVALVETWRPQAVGWRARLERALGGGDRAPAQAVGRLKADARGLELALGEGEAQRVVWDRPFRLQASVWPVSYNTAELTIALRARDAPPTAPSLRFKAVVPQAMLHPDLPVQRQSCPYVAPEALMALWPALRFYARLQSDGDAPRWLAHEVAEPARAEAQVAR